MARKSWCAPAKSCASRRTCRTKPGPSKIQWTWIFSIRRAKTGSTKPTPTSANAASGDAAFTPTHTPHEAWALEDTVDLDIFDPPREDWLNKTDAYLRQGR